MKPQQGRTARYILWALGFPLALWLAAALADAFSGCLLYTSDAADEL